MLGKFDLVASIVTPHHFGKGVANVLLLLLIVVLLIERQSNIHIRCH